MKWLMARNKHPRGFTLIEMIIAIVIIGIAVSGVLLVMNYTTAHSADPAIQAQAVTIAESYMEEIRLHSFADPDGSESGSETRATYDDIFDYDGLSEAPTDQTGTAITGLGSYTVSVDVAGAGGLGPSGTLVPNTAAAEITVRVQYGSMVDFTLTGYRTRY